MLTTENLQKIKTELGIYVRSHDVGAGKVEIEIAKDTVAYIEYDFDFHFLAGLMLQVVDKFNIVTAPVANDGNILADITPEVQMISDGAPISDALRNWETRTRPGSYCDVVID